MLAIHGHSRGVYRKWPWIGTYSNTVNVGVAVQLESDAKLSFTQLNQASGPTWVHNGDLESSNEFLPPDPELSLKVDLTGMELGQTRFTPLEPLPHALILGQVALILLPFMNMLGQEIQ